MFDTVVGVAYLVIWLVALGHCILRDERAGWKIGWCLVIIFIPVVGIILYVFVGIQNSELRRELRDRY